MKKRILFVLLSILLAMLLVACQEEENGEPQSDEPQSSEAQTETEVQPVPSATFVTLEPTEPAVTANEEASGEAT